MPFVRVVDRNPNLPHQIYLTISQDQHDYVISCQCMPASGAGREEIARVSFAELTACNGSGTRLILDTWKKAKHNPSAVALDDAAIGEATATRWVWVDLGDGSPPVIG